MIKVSDPDTNTWEAVSRLKKQICVICDRYVYQFLWNRIHIQTLTVFIFYLREEKGKTSEDMNTVSVLFSGFFSLFFA